VRDEDHRAALEHAADVAAVGAELLDDLRVSISHRVIVPGPG
jgi:hypothetical protein